MTSKRSSIDWLEALDFDRANKNVEIDVKGDWYRDPWAWPEIGWALKNNRDLLARRADRGRFSSAVPIDVPKENFGTRPALVLDPIDRMVYQALVDRLSIDLIGTQPIWARGWRLPKIEPEPGRYARNDYQWNEFAAHLSTLAGIFDYGLKTDVVSFFASVDLDTLGELVADRAGQGLPQSRLADALLSWTRVIGRGGLPQRSFASAVLANAYMKPVDDLLSYYGRVSGLLRHFAPEGSACRWMDDIWIFGDDAGELRQAQVELQQAMRSLGLNMNLAKTDVLEGDDLMKEARQIDHSAVDEGLVGEPEDRDRLPLNELIDRLVAHPEHASRTSIRFVTTRMRWYSELDRVGDLVDVAHRMPHGADHLARLFRDSERWRDLSEWYIEYCRGPWSSIEWSIAQFGTMFPSNATPHSTVVEQLSETLSTGRSGLPVSTLAAQRLSAWDPDGARLVIRDVASRRSDPLSRRSLALAALSAGEERRFVREILREFSETAVTLEMLEHRKFRKLKLATDF